MGKTMERLIQIKNKTRKGSMSTIRFAVRKVGISIKLRNTNPINKPGPK